MPEMLLQGSYGIEKSTLDQITATAGNVQSGVKFLDKNGNIQTGTLSLSGNAGTGDVKSGKTFYSNSWTKHTGTLALSGNASASQVLSGRTFYSNSWTKQTGTMVNRGAVSKSISPGSSYTIPAGDHNGSGKVTANKVAGPTITPVNRTVGWGSGVLFNGYNTKSGSSNHVRVCLKYWCRTEYNVNGYICIMRNGKEVHATVFNKHYDSPYNDDNPNGFIDKTFSGSGTYSIQIKVDYQAGNGEIKFGGALIGY